MVRGGARAGHRNGQRGIRAQIRFVQRAVKIDQLPIDRRLIERVVTLQLAGNQIVDVTDGLEHTFAASNASDRRRAAQPLRARRLTRPKEPRARPTSPVVRRTSASTVGLPRESRISRA